MRMPGLCPARSAANRYRAAGLADGPALGSRLALALGLGLGDGAALDGAGAGFGDDGFGFGEADGAVVVPPVSPVGASVPGALLPAVKVCVPPWM